MLNGVLCCFNSTIDNCRGQCYDGAANMRGQHCRPQALLHQEEPRTLYVHCLVHLLALVLQEIEEQNDVRVSLVLSRRPVCGGSLCARIKHFRRRLLFPFFLVWFSELCVFPWLTNSVLVMYNQKKEWKHTTAERKFKMTLRARWKPQKKKKKRPVRSARSPRDSQSFLVNGKYMYGCYTYLNIKSVWRHRKTLSWLIIIIKRRTSLHVVCSFLCHLSSSGGQEHLRPLKVLFFFFKFDLGSFCKHVTVLWQAKKTTLPQQTQKNVKQCSQQTAPRFAYIVCSIRASYTIISVRHKGSMYQPSINNLKQWIWCLNIYFGISRSPPACMHTDRRAHWPQSGTQPDH